MSRAFSVCTGAATGLGVTMAARQGCCEDTGCDRAFLRHQGADLRHGGGDRHDQSDGPAQLRGAEKGQDQRVRKWEIGGGYVKANLQR